MERNVPTLMRWKCPDCGFHSSLGRAVAQAVHQSCSRQCLSGLLLDETQQTTSETFSVSDQGHLESDDVIVPPANRLGQQHPNSWLQPFGVQCSEGASSAKDFWPAPRWSDDMIATAELRRVATSSQHPYSFPQPPGQSEDEGSGDFNSGQQRDSADVANLRDIPQAGERREGPIQQPTGSRTEQAIRIKKELQCAICCLKWRSDATAECHHLGCCETCFPQTDGTCVVCSSTVTKSFPVKFHSSKLLKDLDIPFPLNVTIEGDNLQVYLHMGLPGRNLMKRAIHLQSNRQALPDANSVLDFMVDNPNPVPSAEEMEPLLTDLNLDDTVKNRLCDYLEAISKCMLCRCNVASICLMPCRHLALCGECFERQPKPEECPDCGMQIEHHVAVYLR